MTSAGNLLTEHYPFQHLHFDVPHKSKFEETKAKRGRDAKGGGAGSVPPGVWQARGPAGQARTCCFMVFVSHSSSLPGTWFGPLLPMSSAEKSTWEARLGAAAEQTKEAPLGLHARDRILQHRRGSALRGHGKGEMEKRPSQGPGCRAQ